MRNKFRETGLEHNKKFAKSSMQTTDSPSRFQIFFVTNDQTENEVLETNIKDFEEILQRVKMGESVLIKHKTNEMFEQQLKTKKEENKLWYFNRC